MNFFFLIKWIKINVKDTALLVWRRETKKKKEAIKYWMSQKNDAVINRSKSKKETFGKIRCKNMYFRSLTYGLRI